MSLSLTLKQFNSLFVVENMVKLRNPKKIKTSDFRLPVGSVIHFLSEGDELGIQPSHPLLLGTDTAVSIFHVDDLVVVLGNVRKLGSSNDKLRKSYHKRFLAFKNLRELEKGLRRDKELLVVNYGFLSRRYTYSSSNLLAYHEWYNNRATLWDQIKSIGSEHVHFVTYQMPEELPTINSFDSYVEKVTPSTLTKFPTTNTLNLLELWRLASNLEGGYLSALEPDTLKETFLVLSEGTLCVVLNAGMLAELAVEDAKTLKHSLYALMTNLIETRTSAEEPAGISADEDIVGSPLITTKVKELAAAGKLSGAEQKRIIRLSGKYKTLTDPNTGKPLLESLALDEKDLAVSQETVSEDLPTIIDKSYLKSSIGSMDKDYVNNLMSKDIAATAVSVQKAGVVLLDYKVSKKVSAISDVTTVSLQTMPVNGKVSTVHMSYPTVNENGVFKAGGVKYRMEKQRVELPIVKTKPFQVSLTSDYGKVFVSRNQNNANNYGKWIQKHLVNRGADNADKTVENVKFSLTDFKDEELPRVFTAVGSHIKSFKSGQFQFNWDYDNRTTLYTETELKYAADNELTLCGRKGKVPLGMGTDGNISLMDTVRPVLGTLPFLIDPGLNNGPIEFTELSVFNKRIPVILFLMFLKGLDKTLSMLNLNYRVAEINERIPNSLNNYILKLKDVKYVIDIRKKDDSLLLGGLKGIREVSKGHKAESLNRASGYVSVLSPLGLTPYHLREITLMEDMFVDPITEGYLKKMGQPVIFSELLVVANAMLINDKMPARDQSRLRGYERISGLMYYELVKSIRTLRSRGNAEDLTLDMNPKALWLDILQDQSVALVEESNPIHNLKESEAITFAGHGGRSSVSMVKSTRGYKPTDLGVISTDTPDSQKVGIRTYATANPNVTDLRGTMGVLKDSDKVAAKVLSTSALLAASVTSDDAKRVAFIAIQNSHNVAGPKYSLSPYRTGYEQVMSGRADPLYAVDAKDDGVVTGVEDASLSVKYKDGTTETLKLGTTHGMVSGVSIPHTSTTRLKKGDKFKKNNSLTYNPGFFVRDTLNPENSSMTQGVIAKMAFFESSDTIEDGSVITESLARRLVTPATALKNVVLAEGSSIHNLVNVGDDVEPDTILCTIEDIVTAVVSEGDKEAIESLKRLSSDNPTADAFGVITAVEVLHFKGKGEVSPSVKSLIRKDNKRRLESSEKFSTNEATTCVIDETLHIDGRKLAPGETVVKIYTDYSVPMGTGDKHSIGNQLKATVSRVEVNPIVTKGGEVLDGTFGWRSVEARIVFSVIKTGLMIGNQKEATKKMYNLYKGKKS